MQTVFINHTNHLSAQWSAAQREAALAYAPSIMDMPFPDIPAQWDEVQVWQLARQTAAEIFPLQPAAVLCQGEYTYVLALAALLEKQGVPVVAACSERCVSNVVEPDGTTRRISTFSFVRFRRYLLESAE